VDPQLGLATGVAAFLPLPAGIPADGAWTLRVEPLACDGAAFVVSTRIAHHWLNVTLPDCAPYNWVFNWRPYAFPPATKPAPGTILFQGPGAAYFDEREAIEATYYQHLTPYYNTDNTQNGATYSEDYSLLAGNSNPLSEKAAPGADDNGDGVPNRGDSESWVTPWLQNWSDENQLGLSIPDLPNADLWAEDAERELARSHPELSPWLRELVDYGPAEATPGSAVDLAFTVHTDNVSQEAYIPTHGPLMYRTFDNLLLDVPTLPDGAPAFTPDLNATNAEAPEGWQASAWQDPAHGTRIMFQADPYHRLGMNDDITFHVAASAAAESGRGAWNVTILYGPSVPERRFAFPEATLGS
jgi:hypothetical protein